METPPKFSRPTCNELLRYLAVIGLLIIVFGGAFFIAREVYWTFPATVWQPIAMKHFPAVIGLPAACVASLFIVLVLEKTTGKIEFEVFQLKFRGASGPVVLWLLCFLGMAAAIFALWEKVYP